MNDPKNPLGWETWRRGAWLGLRLALVLFGVTLLAWLVMGLFGWSGELRALCAMGIGPVLAVCLILGWWVFRGKNRWAGIGQVEAGDKE